MACGYYLDTSIWLDLFEQRGPHGAAAKQLLDQAVLEGLLLHYSDFVCLELKHAGYSTRRVVDAFARLPRKAIRRIHVFKAQKDLAKDIGRERGVPFGDSLHAILCHDYDLVLVSRDAHFMRLRDFCDTRRPEDLI